MEKRNTPPDRIPDELRDAYTLNGKIPVMYEYYDESAPSPARCIPLQTYENVFAQLEARSFIYYDAEIFSFYEALEQYPPAGKDVLIWGLAGCNCDAMAVWKGARHVWVVDYNPLRSEHPDVTSMDHTQLRDVRFRFDYAFSYSSFEHDGLGRYGDPLAPDADLAAMRSAWEYLKPGGLLLLGVPLGPDTLVWNAHRIYGPLRLPKLLQGFVLQDVYSVYTDIDFEGPALGEHQQALLVLRKASKRSVNAMLLDRMEHARKLPENAPGVLADAVLLRKILAMQLAALEA